MSSLDSLIATVALADGLPLAGLEDFIAEALASHGIRTESVRVHTGKDYSDLCKDGYDPVTDVSSTGVGRAQRPLELAVSMLRVRASEARALQAESLALRLEELADDLIKTDARLTTIANALGAPTKPDAPAAQAPTASTERGPASEGAKP